MRVIESRHHVRPECNTSVNSYRMVNDTRPCDFLATEEELAASQYELSEIEALLLHLYDKKKLLLDRIRRLNDAIQATRNQQQAYDYGVSTINPTSYINRSQSSRINGRAWSEVVSGHPNQLLRDRPTPKTDNSLHDLESVPHKRPFKTHNTIRNSMDLQSTTNHPHSVNDQSLRKREKKSEWQDNQ